MVDVFSAVAHSTRRAILDVLAERSRTVTDLVDAFPNISQPAVSKHLKVLKENGLVTVQIHAQQRIYSLQPNGLVEIDNWISKYKIFWSSHLDALERHLSKNKENGENKIGHKIK